MLSLTNFVTAAWQVAASTANSPPIAASDGIDAEEPALGDVHDDALSIVQRRVENRIAASQRRLKGDLQEHLPHASRFPPSTALLERQSEFLVSRACQFSRRTL